MVQEKSELLDALQVARNKIEAFINSLVERLIERFYYLHLVKHFLCIKEGKREQTFYFLFVLLLQFRKLVNHQLPPSYLCICTMRETFNIAFVILCSIHVFKFNVTLFRAVKMNSPVFNSTRFYVNSIYNFVAKKLKALCYIKFLDLLNNPENTKDRTPCSAFVFAF